MSDRVSAAWERVEGWLGSHLPQAVENLRPPATELQLSELEQALGRPLPDPLLAMLQIHDGENDGWVPSAFPDGHWLLPSAQIASLFEQQASLAEEMGGNEEVFGFWKAQVEDGIIFIQGSVKPFLGSRAWIPISTMDGHVQRFLDFDPAPGGTEGQVIEVDVESCLHRVLAPSLADFLEDHAARLERGDFGVDESGLVTPEGGAGDPTGWGLPDYLVGPLPDAAQAGASRAGAPLEGPPFTDGHQSEGEVTLEGDMGVLMGGPEILFSLHTDDGQERTFLAKPRQTKGYAAIAVRQRARVRAVPYTSKIESVFVEQMGSEPPEFFVVEYALVR